MKIPNSHQAVIDLEKLAGYCLDSTHWRGKHKARLFSSILGLTPTDAPELKAILQQVVTTDQAELGLNNEHGQRYKIDFEICRSGARALVRSCWIIRPNEDFPRLTSCYILRSLP
jgi:hypothetical protein